MKIIYAEPGTDPTRTPFQQGQKLTGLPQWVTENKWLVLAVLVFVVVSVARFMPARSSSPVEAFSAPETYPEQQIAVKAQQEPLQCVGGPPGEWQGFFDAGRYDDGAVYVLQIEPQFKAKCENGAWTFDFE